MGCSEAARAIVWVDGVLVWEYAGGETLGVESLASICKMWAIKNGNYNYTKRG